MGLGHPHCDQAQDAAQGLRAAGVGIVCGDPQVKQFEIVGLEADADQRARLARAFETSVIRTCGAHLVLLSEDRAEGKIGPFRPGSNLNRLIGDDHG